MRFMLGLHSGDKTASPRLNPGPEANPQPKALPASVGGREDKWPWRGKWSDRDLDQGRAVTPGKSPPQRGTEFLRGPGALGGCAKAIREFDEIRVGEIAGNKPVPEA